jgi:hypothetical protein
MTPPTLIAPPRGGLERAALPDFDRRQNLDLFLVGKLAATGWRLRLRLGITISALRAGARARTSSMARIFQFAPLRRGIFLLS